MHILYRLPKRLHLASLTLLLLVSASVHGEEVSQHHMIILNSPKRNHPDFSMEEEFGIVEHRYQTAYPNHDLGDAFINDLQQYQMLYLGQKASEDTRGIFVHPQYKEAITAFLRRGGVLFVDYFGCAAHEATQYFQTIGVDFPQRLGTGADYPAIPNPAHRKHTLLNTPHHLDAHIRAAFWWEQWSDEQTPLFVSKSDPSHAAMIVQQNVLGKGTVIFSHMPDMFRRTGRVKGGQPVLENTLSFIYGQDITEYKQQRLEVQQGPGKPMPVASNVIGHGEQYASQPARTIFLRSMTTRPWWSSTHQLRIPVLVSEPIGKARRSAVIDFEYDFERPLSPDSIRVITAYGAEVPSQVIERPGTGLEIVFLTDLRPYEQKPFLIYANARTPRDDPDPPLYDTDLTIDTGRDLYRITNDVLDVEFSKRTTRPGRVDKIRIRGSPSDNQLSVLSTGGAWYGHSIVPGPDKTFYLANPKESTAELLVDGPLKKTIAYVDAAMTVKYTVYSFSNRIDYELIPAGSNVCGSRTAWLTDGGSALDKIYYEGTKGIRRLAGERNEIFDGNAFYPHYELRKWLKEGWIGIEDADSRTTVGEFFDTRPLRQCDILSQGINGGENITLEVSLAEPVRGALVAVGGDYLRLRDEYLDWKNPPLINVGPEQPFFEAASVAPDYEKGVTRGFKTEIRELRDSNRKDEHSGRNLIETVRRYGGNSVKLDRVFRHTFPMDAERLASQSDEFKSQYALKGNYIREICAAAARSGVAVRFWYDGKTKRTWVERAAFEAGAFEQDLRDYLQLAAAGVDFINLQTGGEWHNRGVYNAEDLERERQFNAWTEVLVRAIKDKYPDLPVGILCSGSGRLRRYVDIEGKAPYLDTLEAEIIHHNLIDTKYGTRYPLGCFGNDGRSIQHHFYYYKPDPSNRIWDMEIPMMFGIKSFCLESLSNKLNNPELVEITADFYRFIDHTGLEDFVGRARPVEFLGVLRDREAFVDDVRKENFRFFSERMSLFEARCKDISGMRNVPVNVIVNRFCTLRNLQRYRVIMVPSNPVMGDELAEVLVQYVKSGGCLITEDQSARSAIIAAAAGIEWVADREYDCRQLVAVGHGPALEEMLYSTTLVKPAHAQTIFRDEKQEPAVFLSECGDGRIIYCPYVLSDNLGQSPQKAGFIKALIRDHAGRLPVQVSVELENRVDSCLLTDGKEYLLGVYNPSHDPVELDVKLNVPVGPQWHCLDVKASRRFECGRQFKVTVPAAGTGFYLIGGDELTGLPETNVAAMVGASASVVGMKCPGGGPGSFELKGGEKQTAVGVFRAKKGDGKAGSQNYGGEAIYESLVGSGIDTRLLNPS